MRYTIVAATGLVACLTLLGGCARTTVVSNWNDPAYTEKMKKVIVIGMSNNEARRSQFEYTLADALKAERVDASPSTALLPPREEPTKELIQAAIEGKGYDTALVTRLVSATTKETYVPGTAELTPKPVNSSLYNYYAYTYPNVQMTGYLETETVVKLETNVYETGSAKLVWSLLSQSFDPKDINKEMEAVAKLIIKQLKQDGKL